MVATDKLKDTLPWLKVATTLEKPTTPTPKYTHTVQIFVVKSQPQIQHIICDDQ